MFDTQHQKKNITFMIVLTVRHLRQMLHNNGCLDPPPQTDCMRPQPCRGREHLLMRDYRFSFFPVWHLNELTFVITP